MTIKPPASLSKPAADLWTKFVTQYALDDIASLTLLESALNSWDRAQRAEMRLRKEGLTVTLRSGYVRPHSCVSIARDANKAFLAAMRALDFDEAPKPASKGGRPAYLPVASSPFRKIGQPND